MRTIRLRQNEHGHWSVAVTLTPNSFHSLHWYATMAQAQRAFVAEGRSQPCARMLIQHRSTSKAIVIRSGRRWDHPDFGAAVDLMSIKSALDNALRCAVRKPIASMRSNGVRQSSHDRGDANP